MKKHYPNEFAFVLRQFLVWLMLLFGHQCVLAQADTSQHISVQADTSLSATKFDSTQLTPAKKSAKRARKARQAITDSMLTQRDSVFYTRLKASMYKRRLTREIYDALFQDVYNSRTTTGEVSQLEVNPFKLFEGTNYWHYLHPSAGRVWANGV